jgi:hypothetical protein
VLLIGQSLELSLPQLLPAVRARDGAALLHRVQRQIEAGAEAIDLNGGVQAGADDLAWCVRATWDALPGVPLLIDSASPALLADALETCHNAGVVGPFVANSIPVGDAGVLGAEAIRVLSAAVRAKAGVVLSPRAADAPDAGGVASARQIVHAALAATEAVRAAGVTAPIYLDALAFPPLSDPARCARSLDVLRAWRDVEGVQSLTAVGNVAYGADATLATAMRAVYAAAATGAGAQALLLPVEEPATVRAVRLATREEAPVTSEDHWLVEVAAAAGTGAPPGRPPAAYEHAARLILGTGEL